MPVTMTQLLEEMVQRNSTDLHLTAGSPPMFRIDGELVPTNYEIMTPELIKNLAYSVLNDHQKKKFEMEWELDFSFSIAGLSRFRGNCFQQRGSVAVACDLHVGANLESHGLVIQDVRGVVEDFHPLECRDATRHGSPRKMDALRQVDRGQARVEG